MELTIEQRIFLERYLATRGDINRIMEDMRLTINDLMHWRKQESFEKEFTQTKQNLMSFLNSENKITALRNLNEGLRNGMRQDSVQHTHKVEKGISSFDIKRTTKKVNISPELIRLALSQSSIMQAINTLTTEGILPEGIARKILSKSEEIAGEMQKAFAHDSTADVMPQDLAVSLIKAAVLGSNDNV
jgi:hypothetical protein